MLRRWLHRPLRDRTALRARYQAVATLMDGSLHTAIAGSLRKIGDLERILARIALRSARPPISCTCAPRSARCRPSSKHWAAWRSPAPRRCSSSCWLEWETMARITRA